MITFRPMGQWGNQVFSYLACKIMAEVNHLPFRSPPAWINRHHRNVAWSGPPFAQMESTDYPIRNGQTRTVHVQHWCDWQTHGKVGQIDVVHGYFQRYELFRPWKDQIKNEWLRFLVPFIEADPDTVYVHCRLADYVIGQGGIRGCNGVANTIEEYRACLEHFPDAGKLIVCTDAPRDPWLENFNSLGLPWELSRRPWDQDFMLLASARWLIICQSTFSWWAGLLGRAEKIACPLSDGTLWAKGHGRLGPPESMASDWINLEVDDEPGRWVWIR